MLLLVPAAGKGVGVLLMLMPGHRQLQGLLLACMQQHGWTTHQWGKEPVLQQEDSFLTNPRRFAGVQ